MELDDVDFIEEDKPVQGATTYYPLELGWHLDRIDQRYLPLDGRYQPNHGYTGRGVDIYIMDSGVRYSHKVFGGRARYGGYDAYGSNGEDCHGHGTHCAGLAGGKLTGAAYGANIYSLRVLNCQNGGSFSHILAALNLVVEKARNSKRPTIVSMSLIGPKSDYVERALKRAYENGVVAIAAAGNFRSDACDYHPAASRYAITVGGTQEDGDHLYWFSSSSRSPGTNFGKCVDIFAPGQWIRSAGHQCYDCLISMSGTSMATPITAGAAALLLEEDPSLTPRGLRDRMRRRATSGVIDFSKMPSYARSATSNLLVYVGIGEKSFHNL